MDEQVTLEAIVVTAATKRWLEMLHEHLLEGEPPELAMKPDVTEVVRALHHVVAGGTAEVELGGTPTKDHVERLNAAHRNAIAEHRAVAVFPGVMI